jgi:hypothetical protein
LIRQSFPRPDGWFRQSPVCDRGPRISPVGGR